MVPLFTYIAKAQPCKIRWNWRNFPEMWIVTQCCITKTIWLLSIQTTNFVNKYGELVVSELEAGSSEEDTCLENIKKNKDFKFVKVF